MQPTCPSQLILQICKIWHFEFRKTLFIWLASQLSHLSGDKLQVGKVFDAYETHSSEDAQGIFLLINEPFQTGVIYQWVFKLNVLLFRLTFIPMYPRQSEQFLKCNYTHLINYFQSNEWGFQIYCPLQNWCIDGLILMLR